jgi:uncharacterized protein (DUF433 family)
MSREYVEVRDGGFYLAGSRVSLASIVYEHREGATAEAIRRNFPTLSIEQIHGAIAFYLAHREETDVYLHELDRKWADVERSPGTDSADIQRRLEEGRRRLLTKQA